MTASNTPAAPAQAQSSETSPVGKASAKAPATKPPVKVSTTAVAPARRTTQPAASTKAAAQKVAKASPIAAEKKPAKAKKIKMVRDSFTIPKSEFAVLDALKLRATELSAAVKKTELIRAGIKALAAMNDANFLAAIRAVPSLKTGRPSKS